MTVIADLSGLRNIHTPGADPGLIKADLLDVIGRAITAHPRSQQKRIGPSGLGHPCDRWMAFTLAQVDPFQPTSPMNDGWLQTIGTAVHAWLADQFMLANTAYRETAGAEDTRYLVEQKVSAGEINGEDIDGSTDLYDRVPAAVIDWKISTKNRIKTVFRPHGPGQQYRVQAHAYGRGWARRGMPVETVAVMVLPRDGELKDAWFWHEPYDEQVAVEAFARAARVDSVVKGLGIDKAAPLMQTADAYCHRCPFFVPGSTDVASGCPGDASRAVRPDSFVTDLIA